MKIAFIVPSLRNAGPISVVKDMVKSLIYNGDECTVFYFDDIVELEFDCKTQKISFWGNANLNEFDIIHSHCVRPDIYVFIRSFIYKNKVLITTLHSFLYEEAILNGKSKIYAKLLLLLYIKILHKSFKRIITLSKISIEYYHKKGIPLCKLHCLYNTRYIDMCDLLNTDDVNDVLKFKGNNILIGVNVGITYRKGLDQLINALPFLEKYSLYVVGDGPAKNELIELAKSKNVLSRCYFAGYKQDAYKYLPYYDIYAMVSRSEGFPLVLLESMIFKKKIICSNLPIFNEIFDGDEVCIYELDNIMSLVYNIKSIEYKTEIGEKAYSKYINSYSPNIMYKQYKIICSNN